MSNEFLTAELSDPIPQGALSSVVTTEEFNRPFADYEAAVLRKCTEGLTEAERAEVMLWFKGNQPAGFWESVSRPAHGAILELCSMGLG